jgi:hypothetical protein
MKESADIRFRAQTGRDLLKLRSSQLTPEQTSSWMEQGGDHLAVGTES